MSKQPKVQIKSIFNENGKSLQKVIEEDLINYYKEYLKNNA